VAERAADFARMMSSRLERLMADSWTSSAARVTVICDMRISMSGRLSLSDAPVCSGVSARVVPFVEADPVRADPATAAVDARRPVEKNSCRAAEDRLLPFCKAERPAAANLAKMAGKRSSLVHNSSMLATTRVSLSGFR